MYGEILRRTIIPIHYRNWWTYYQQLKETCKLPLEEIKRIQSEGLCVLIKHAYENVPYYHKTFKEAGVKPNDIKNSEDLVKLPILTRSDVRENFNDLIATNFPKEKLVPNATGGSTGEPLQFYVTKESEAWGAAAAHRAYEWYGYEVGDKIAYLWGSPVDSSAQERTRKKLSNFVFRRTYLNAFNMSEEEMERFAQKLIKFKPKAIIAYASAAYIFSRYVKNKGIEGIRPKVIISQAEKLFDYQREMIEEILECKVFDFYGSREIYTMASECIEHAGYHISAENIVLEFVRNGKHVSLGEKGNILVTNLHNYAMPFIRYENGDIGVPTNETCSCGINLPLMKSIEGRITDALVIGGTIISSPSLTLVFKNHPIKQYQLVQETENKIVIKIVKAEGYSPKNTEELYITMRKIVGDNVGLDILFIDNIPPAKSGKHKFIIQNLAQFHILEKSVDNWLT